MKNIQLYKKAIVIGATGLVGKQLVSLLVASEQYEKVTIVVRKFQVQYAEIKKVQQLVLDDFLMLNEEDVNGYTHAFSCLGTTLKQAKSKQNFYNIDYGINMHFAELLQNKAVHYLLISAAGASTHTLFFYSRVKGQLERDVQSLSFSKISIIQPSLLIGEHSDTRFFEKWSQRIFLKTEKYLRKQYKYKPVTAVQVAKTLVEVASIQTENFKIYDNLDIQNLSGRRI